MKARKPEDIKMNYDKQIQQYHESRITRLEVVVENINGTLARLDQRMDTIQKDMKDGFNRLDQKIDSNFKWQLGMTIGGFAGVLGVVAHALRWF